MTSKPANSTPAAHRHPDPELRAMQRRLARHGVHLQLPTAGPDWQLPDMIEVEGELPSEALIRLRRANRP